MWFELDLSGARKKQLRELDAAILLAHRLYDTLKAQPAGTDPKPLVGAEAFMTAVQIRSLLKLGGSDLSQALRREGSPFDAAFSSAPQWSDSGTLATALKSFGDLLEGKRNILSAKEPENRRTTTAVGKQKNGGGGTVAPLASPVAPGDALLWTATEKLYASWPVRIIFVAICFAIALALGGSYVIGGQTLNIRQDLDKAQERAQAEIRGVSEATQSRLSKESENVLGRLSKESETVLGRLSKDTETLLGRLSKESETVLGGLRDRGAEINGQLQRAEKEVAELKTGSEKIKSEIIDRLQKSLKDEESNLREAVLEPLIKIRDQDILKFATVAGNLDKSLQKMTTDVTDQRTRLVELGAKLDQLRTYADQSDKIGGALSTINVELEAARKGRMSAETEANTATLKRQAAEYSATEAEAQHRRVGEALKGASDETLRHNRALALVESQLEAFRERLKSVEGKTKEIDNKGADIDGKLKASDRKQKDADSKLYTLDGQVSVEEEHLRSLKQRIDILGQNLPKVAPTTMVDPAVLSVEERMMIQRELAKHFPLEKVDGNFGKKTLAAIRAYQASIKAEVTGRLSRDQFEALSKSAKNLN